MRLQPGMRRLWDSLQPNGKLDVNATVQFDAATRKTSVWLRAFPRDDATSIGTSIEPVTFPYRMRLRSGYIDYHDGHADLYKIHAVHGATELHTGGSCDIWPDGGWRLQLRDMTVDRVHLHGVDHDLDAALPGALRRAASELKPSGPINLKGAIDFAQGPAGTPLQTAWNVDLFLHRSSIQAGPMLENIFGRVGLRGSSRGALYSSHGELDLDSLTYKNFQFTGISGPLWFDNGNVYLGALSPVTDSSVTPRRRITARLLGGVLAGDCHVRLSTAPQFHPPQYLLSATLSQADLAQFARENLPGGQRLNGKIAAQIELAGTPGPRNLTGSGSVHLSDADVYELPLMVSLLKIVRAKAPDSTAFTQAEINFDIQQGEHIILKQINLDGDAISLSGNGELTLDGQTNPISLRLHTSAGKTGLPIVSGLLTQASRQILLIHVGGTLEHPETRTEPFPVANQALQQLQAEPGKPGILQADNWLKTFGLRR